MQIDDHFPRLRELGHRITSPATTNYNCIAWAAGHQDDWWWPDPMGTSYWPAAAPRAETVAAFVQAFGLLGYVPCDTGAVEAETEKVALYAKDGMPTHAARQRPDGRWTSKLGTMDDIDHALEGLTGSVYGQVVQVLKRPSAGLDSSGSSALG